MQPTGAEPLRKNDPPEIGPYRLLGRIGEGGMGTVFLGVAPAGRLVAVKVVKPDLTIDEDFAGRFHSEVENARKVASFCTAEVLDNGNSADGMPYMVTEYIAGTPLSRQISQYGALEQGPLHGVALGVAAALAAIHVAGLVHRDLKPANVILSMSGPRVIDFGIARALDSTHSFTQSGVLLGSPGWWAPEQVRGEEITTATDIFAWGCLVAYAGNGRHPYGRGDAVTLAARVLNAGPDLGTLPPPLDELAQLATDPDPQRRPTAQDLLIALVGGVLPEPTQAASQTQTLMATEMLSESWEPPANVSKDSPNPTKVLDLAALVSPEPVVVLDDVTPRTAPEQEAPAEEAFWEDTPEDAALTSEARRQAVAAEAAVVTDAGIPTATPIAPPPEPVEDGAAPVEPKGTLIAPVNQVTPFSGPAVEEPSSETGDDPAATRSTGQTAKLAVTDDEPATNPGRTPSTGHSTAPSEMAAAAGMAASSATLPSGSAGAFTIPDASGPSGTARLPSTSLAQDGHEHTKRDVIPEISPEITYEGVQGGAQKSAQDEALRIEPAKRRSSWVRWLLAGVAVVAALTATAVVLLLANQDGNHAQGGPTKAAKPPKAVVGPDVGRRISLVKADTQILIPQPPRCGVSTYQDSTAKQGGFCLIRWTMLNSGGELAGIGGTTPRLLDGKGDSYQPEKSSTALPTALPPGGKVDGVLIFDLPSGRTPTKLVLADDVEVDL